MSDRTLLVFCALNNQPSAANAATLDTRNQHPVLDFNDSSGEEAVFSSVMPRQYGGGGVTVDLHYSMTSATVGDVDWNVAFERVGDRHQDVDSDGFAAQGSVANSTVPAVSGLVDIVSVTFADGSSIDSIAPGDKFRLKVSRDGASDTALGDAELHAVEIREA